jgi:hypothetical protein
VSKKAAIPQAEIQRAIRAAKAAGGPDTRVIIDLPRQRLEIILSPSNVEQDNEGPNPWEIDGAPS